MAEKKNCRIFAVGYYSIVGLRCPTAFLVPLLSYLLISGAKIDVFG